MDGGSRLHFDLLRKEHLELTSRYTSLLHDHDVLQADIGRTRGNGLASSLVRLVKSLHNSGSLSDLNIMAGDSSFKSHKLVILARSNYWTDLEALDSITINAFTAPEVEMVLNWVYTDSIDTSLNDKQLLRMAEASTSYGFTDLQDKCTSILTSRLDISNCVSIFEFADKANISKLRSNCADLVAARWNEFTKESFAPLSAPLLYKLLKGHSSNVLQSIVELEREDVLFLFFIEHNAQLNEVLNDASVVPCALESSLELATFSIADQLIEHGADINLQYSSTGGQKTILMRMIEKGHTRACQYLTKKGVSFKGIQDSAKMLSPIQQIAMSPLTDSLLDWTTEIIGNCDVDFVTRFQGGDERTALLSSSLNESVAASRLVSLLLSAGANPNVTDGKGRTALYHSLLTLPRLHLARLLVDAGADINACVHGEPLIHAVLGNDESFAFLLDESPDVDAENSKGSSLLHAIILRMTPSNVPSGVDQLVRVLKAGASVNAVDAQGDTPLHLAIRQQYAGAIAAIVAEAKDIDWSIRDSAHATPLELALSKRMFETSEQLIRGGAPINDASSTGESLLQSALLKGDDETAVFLLSNKADHTKRDASGRSSLELALSGGLSGAVKALCGAGVNINERCDGGAGFTVIERALAAGHLECASLLCSFGCDVESWNLSDDCEQTLLHHMMDCGNQPAAVFLIERGCDVNSLKRYKNAAEDDQQSPLHMAVGWGLSQVVKALVDKGAVLTSQDSDGRTACHIAVRESNGEALALLLAASDVSFIGTRDKLGQTPLSLAIARRDHKAAAAIVNRQPHAALQTNGNGENLLHVAVRSNDLESVLFLLGTHTDPTRTTHDAERRTALHIAAQADNELIMRNLILAGCVVDARTADGSTPLHEAVRSRRVDLVAILMENNANANITDQKGDTVLLSAVRSGSIGCVRLLLQHGSVDTRAVNKQARSALHICASLSVDRMEKGGSAAELCELLLSHEERQLGEKEMAAFVDARDVHGNSALLTAYICGNAGVCRMLLRRGAALGSRNADGITVFTHETPTKQLLFGLLEALEREPRWSEGDGCDCGARFSITQRKHHCRHCGRVVCSACSSVSMPILKFGEEKKVRVCSMCTLVLTQGAPR